MAGETKTFDQFQPLIRTARTAFQTDPSYAIAIAQQASALLMRRQTKQEKAASTDEMATSGV